MTPIDQTEFSSPDGTRHGNCFSACLASITGIPLSEIPNFVTLHKQTGGWFQVFMDLLRKYDFDCYGTVYVAQHDDWWSELRRRSDGIDGYFIVGGSSPRGVTNGHAVVYKDGVMVHDPHPSRLGLKAPEDVLMIERAL